MKNIAVFYHIWSPANTDCWKFIVDEQLKKIYINNLSDFSDVYCTISGPLAKNIKKYVKLFDWVHILEVVEENIIYEGLTLRRLHEYVLNNPSIQAVMYLHTKGISHLAGQSELSQIPGIDVDRMFKSINSWRFQLEWAVIERWKESIEKLNENHVVGVNYLSKPWPHMSGNFWWARADYIRELDHPTLGEYKFDPNDFGNAERMKHEKWIGTKNPKVFSFHDAPSLYDEELTKPDVQPQIFEPKSFWPYRDDLWQHFRKYRKIS